MSEMPRQLQKNSLVTRMGAWGHGGITHVMAHEELAPVIGGIKVR